MNNIDYKIAYTMAVQAVRDAVDAVQALSSHDLDFPALDTCRVHLDAAIVALRSLEDQPSLTGGNIRQVMLSRASAFIPFGDHAKDWEVQIRGMTTHYLCTSDSERPKTTDDSKLAFVFHNYFEARKAAQVYFENNLDISKDAVFLVKWDKPNA